MVPQRVTVVPQRVTVVLQWVTVGLQWGMAVPTVVTVGNGCTYSGYSGDSGGYSGDTVVTAVVTVGIQWCSGGDVDPDGGHTSGTRAIPCPTHYPGYPSTTVHHHPVPTPCTRRHR